MKICFITNKYPNIVEPNAIVFLQQLVMAIAKKGVECKVICPVPVNLNRKYNQLPAMKVEKYDGAQVEVYFPRYFGLGQRDILCFNPAKITTHFFTKAVEKVIDSWDCKPDIYYAHFVTPAGITAAKLGRKHGIPAFMAYGEATLNTINHYGKKAVAKELGTLAGVIAVSSQNKEMIEPFVPKGITEVFPNSIDDTLFYKHDKNLARSKWNIDPNDFIVAFVGSFDERKGINRLSDAVDRVEGVKVICAGKGALEPKTDKCVFKGPVLHSELPLFLSAADVFVLPTRNEGCCNAIIEAMACGLPIVSANLPFNDDVLDETNSIKIDPNSVDEIVEAIQKLKDDVDLRLQLSNGGLKRAENLTLEKRAENILSFIGERI